MGSMKMIQEKKLLTGFFSEIAQDTGKYCFGLRDINYALEMGAIEILIVDQDLELKRFTIVDSENLESIIFSKDALQENLKIIKEELYIDYLIENHQSFGARLEIVSSNTSQGSQFCNGFGGLGAILRWPVEFEFYEEEHSSPEESSDEDFI